MLLRKFLWEDVGLALVFLCFVSMLASCILPQRVKFLVADV